MASATKPGRRRRSGLDDETYARAVAEPGPTWREYLYYEFLKVWILLGFFIVDVFLAVSWLEPLNVAALVASLVAAFYLEFLAYRYLWYRPDLDTLNPRAPFHRTLTRPVQYGRWTPEADRVRNGLSPFGDALLPTTRSDPKEFL